MEESIQPINIFFCYAEKDKLLADGLFSHFSTLRRLQRVNIWYAKEFVPHSQWEKESFDRLEKADIILLLISANFIDSDYCYGKAMVKALQRFRNKEAYVIPILLRPVDFKDTPFSSLQMLPEDAKPIALWANKDEAFTNVVLGIRRIVIQIMTSRLIDNIQEDSPSRK